MLNERIVASGIYYYKEENISESRLAFRVTIRRVPQHTTNKRTTCAWIFCTGLNGRGNTLPLRPRANQKTAGRALAWPNVYRHRVVPFRLLDPTKPGHRKILAIFLVDPSIEPILSATNIPSQQQTGSSTRWRKLEAIPPPFSLACRQLL
ncbi:hypothetical protein K438DRAFT_1771934 [Mycena galopus ATCC 62051]|nr:hypothetical protein K438DRAFT_1771934 [Mycena galopus ATCC 62051]